MSNASIELDGLVVRIYRGEDDGKLVVEIEGPDESDTMKLGEPDIRIWLNEELIYDSGEYGPEDVPKDLVYPAPPDNDKPIPHVEVVLGVDRCTIGLNFEKGVPVALQELVQSELVKHYKGLHLDRARVSQIEAEVNFMLVSMNECGLVLRDPRFPGRVWDFDEANAEEWVHRRNNPPPLITP